MDVFLEKKAEKWKMESALDELSDRNIFSTGTPSEKRRLWDLLIHTLASKEKQTSLRTLGLLSSIKSDDPALPESMKEEASEKIINFALGREPFILVNAITTLARLGSPTGISFIFVLSTASMDQSVKNHATEALHEFQNKNTANDLGNAPSKHQLGAGGTSH
jgi:hypothetical protein